MHPRRYGPHTLSISEVGQNVSAVLHFGVKAVHFQECSMTVVGETPDLFQTIELSMDVTEYI